MYVLKPVCSVVISAFLFYHGPKRLQLSEETILVDSVIKILIISYQEDSKCQNDILCKDLSIL